jgi:hypothetical protein
MDKILKKLGINEEHSRPVRIKKTFNQVKQNVPHIANYNFMADVLFLPTTKKKNKYLLAVVDIATNACDFEPMKDKSSESILSSFQKIIKRNYLDAPYASIRTDDGSEFRGEFEKWMRSENILHKIAEPGRHKQVGNVEILNRDLGRLLNGYMNSIEEKTGKVFREWDTVLPLVRKMLNEHRTIPEGDPFTDVYEIPNVDIEPKYKIGDIVYRIADEPLDALGKKQPTKNFRMGDYRWDLTPRKIVKILRYSGNVQIRYMLDRLKNVSYAEWEVKPAKEQREMYHVTSVKGYRTVNGVKEILIKYKEFPKASWQNYADIKLSNPLIDKFYKRK